MRSEPPPEPSQPSEESCTPIAPHPVLFATFVGGHDTSWGPSANEYAHFADFAVSTGPIGP